MNTNLSVSVCGVCLLISFLPVDHNKATVTPRTCSPHHLNRLCKGDYSPTDKVKVCSLRVVGCLLVTLRSFLAYNLKGIELFSAHFSILVLQLTSFMCSKLVSKHVDLGMDWKKSKARPGETEAAPILTFFDFHATFKCLCSVSNWILIKVNFILQFQLQFKCSWTKPRNIEDICVELIGKSDSVHLFLWRHQVKCCNLNWPPYLYLWSYGSVSEWLWRIYIPTYY